MGEKKVMIIGLGNIGSYALEFIVRTPGIDSIFAADIDREAGLSRTHNAMAGAAQMGFYPNVEFVAVDVNNIEETASVLKRIGPDVILSCVTLQSWWVISELPKDVYKEFKLIAGFGVWLPMQITPNYKLMQAVREAGIKTHVIVSAFPDAVCPVLAKVGLTPTIGLGNMDNFIPEIKKIVGEKLNINRRDVSLCMIGHHILRTAAVNGGVDAIRKIPFYLKISAKNKDVTGEFDLNQLLVDAVNLVVKVRRDPAVAASGVKNALAILNDTGELTHSPGPNGLVGGYPVSLSSKGAKVVLPEGMSLEEAIRINEKQQKFDGIEKIEDDGAVVCTQPAVEFMKQTLGYDCSRVKIEENEQKAMELRSLYREFIAKLKK